MTAFSAFVRRWISNLVAAVSLLLCLAVVGLWAQSYSRFYVFGVGRATWPQPEVWRDRGVTARLVQGHWLLYWGGGEFHLDHPEGIVRGWTASDAVKFRQEHEAGIHPVYFASNVRSSKGDYLLGVSRWYGFGHKHESRKTVARTDGSYFIVFPAWLPLPALLALPLARAARWWRHRRRRAQARCARCGYDLRGTPEQCPECGTVPEARSGVAA